MANACWVRRSGGVLLAVNLLRALLVFCMVAFPAPADGGSPGEPQGQSEQASGQAAAEQLPGKKPAWFRRLLRKVSPRKLRYYFVAQNTHNCDLLYGLVEDNPFIGRAAVDFVFPNGCDCHGVAQVTHFPLGGPIAGQSGYVKASCSDGRSIKGRFTTTSLTTGNGKASDTMGNEYEFTFGHTAEQSIETVNVIRRKLHCPECTTEDVEMRVQAKIIKDGRTRREKK